MLWLEHGNDAEQELADRIHETFEACLQPAADPEASPLSPILTPVVSSEALDPLQMALVWPANVLQQSLLGVACSWDIRKVLSAMAVCMASYLWRCRV